MASEYIKYLTKDIKPDEPPPPPEKKDRIKNWFYYNKWFILAGIIAVILIADLIRTVLHIGEVTPDVQIAYIGSLTLPDEVIQEMETQLSPLVPDGNGDGKSTLKINSYVFPEGSAEDSTLATIRTSSQVRLMGDFDDCTSFLFLMEDAEEAEEAYNILSWPDGTLPESEEDAVRHTEEYVFAWKDCPALAALTAKDGPLAQYEEASPGLSEYLESLSIGRRGFWTEKTSAYPEACEGFWEALRT